MEFWKADFPFPFGIFQADTLHKTLELQYLFYFPASHCINYFNSFHGFSLLDDDAVLFHNWASDSHLIHDNIRYCQILHVFARLHKFALTYSYRAT